MMAKFARDLWIFFKVWAEKWSIPDDQRAKYSQQCIIQFTHLTEGDCLSILERSTSIGGVAIFSGRLVDTVGIHRLTHLLRRMGLSGTSRWVV